MDETVRPDSSGYVPCKKGDDRMVKDLLEVVERYDCRVVLKKHRGEYTIAKGMVMWIDEDIFLFVKELNRYVNLDEIKNFVF